MNLDPSSGQNTQFVEAPVLERRRFRIYGWVKWLVLAGGALIGLFIGLGYLLDSSRQIVADRYQAIKPGMSRGDVRRLVQGSGTIMYTGIGTSEIMHIDGKFMIAVVYEPPADLPPSASTVAGVPDDHWVAKEKLFLELGRGSQMDNVLVNLNLKPARIVDRVQMPK